MKEMKNVKIGVWLDHSKAYLIENDPFNEQIQTVYSEHDRYEREDGEGSDATFFSGHASNNEDGKEKRLRDRLNTYYKTIEKIITPYNEILLFGPTTAKNEFRNLIQQNKQFANKIIHVEKSDHMSENQMKAYVRDHFKEPVFKNNQ